MRGLTQKRVHAEILGQSPGHIRGSESAITNRQLQIRNLIVQRGRSPQWLLQAGNRGSRCRRLSFLQFALLLPNADAPGT